MNGRLYDPVLARVLSPDHLLNDPMDLQSYNAYSYVRNNSLMYTDPSGFEEVDGSDDWSNSNSYVSLGISLKTPSYQLGFSGLNSSGAYVSGIQSGQFDAALNSPNNFSGTTSGKNPTGVATNNEPMFRRAGDRESSVPEGSTPFSDRQMSQINRALAEICERP